MSQQSSVSLSSDPAGVPAAGTTPSFAEGAASYKRIEGKLDAMRADEVGVVRAYILVVIAVVFGALINIRARLGAMRKATPELDFDALEQLGDYTQALYYLHLITAPTEGPAADLPTLLAEASPLRALLLSSAENLALFGHVSSERVAAIRSGSGHLDTAEDLGRLVQLFREGGPELVARTPVTEAMLERAGELSFQIIIALGQRKVGTDGAGELSRLEEHKARALSLVVRTYNEARRGLSFLRWREGDVDTLAPSIFAGRRRKRNAPADEGPAGDGPVGEGPAGEPGEGTE